MSLFDWVDRGVKKFSWLDVSLVKGTVFFFTLFLITVWEGFRTVVMSFDWYWYLIIGIVLSIIPMKKLYS